MSGLANPNEEKENTGGASASSDDNDSGAPKERKGGLGRDKAARKFANASQEEREAANSDGKFGYYDMVNKRYVPAIVDAMDGGGFDTRGDKFKGGPLSGLLNRLGINPYGSQRERMFVAPNTSSAIQAAVQGGGAPQRSVPTVTESVRPMLRPDNFGQTVQAQQEAAMGVGPLGGAGAQVADPRGFGQGTEPMTLTPAQQAEAQRILGAQADPYAPVGGANPEVAQEIARRQALQAEAQRMQSYEPVGPSTVANPQRNLSAITDAIGMMAGSNMQSNDTSSQTMGLDVDPAMMNELNTSINLLRANKQNMADPAAFSANAPSAAAMTAPTPLPADRNPQLAAFNQAMSTVPEMLKGTQIEDMYRDHLLNGGGGTFAQFTGAQ